MNLEREIKAKAVSNFLAIWIGVMQELYRRPDYKDLLIKFDVLQKEMPEVKKLLMYLSNTEEK